MTIFTKQLVLRSIGAVDNPSSEEFLSHPDYRQVVSFFTGWVFFSSIHYLIFSTFARFVFSRIIVRISAWMDKKKKSAPESTQPPNLESQPENLEKPFQLWASKLQDQIIFSDKEYPTLVFLTTLLFSMASLSQFGSLLRFSPTFSGAETACAFVVAWGGMSAKFAQILSLLILSLELRRIGVKLWESIVFWGLLIVAIGLTLAVNIIASGTIRVINSPISLALCYRRHFLPVSLSLSLLLLLLEVYCLGRFINLLCPSFLRVRHQVDALRDARILRSIGLIILDILTIVPDAVPSNVLGDYIPFSIGAVIVLGLFNAREQGLKEMQRPWMPSPGIHAASYVSFPRFTTYSSHRDPNSPLRLQIPGDATSPISPISQRSYRRRADMWSSMPPSALSERTMDTATAESARRAVITTALHVPPPPQVPTVVPPGLHSPHSLGMTQRSQSVPTLFMPRPIVPNLVHFARQFEEQAAEIQHPTRTRSQRSLRNVTINPQVSYVTSPTSSRRTSQIQASPIAAGGAQSFFEVEVDPPPKVSRKPSLRVVDKLRSISHRSHRTSKHSTPQVDAPQSARSSLRLSSYRNSVQSARFQPPERDLTPVKEKSIDGSTSLHALSVEVPSSSAPVLILPAEELEPVDNLAEAQSEDQPPLVPPKNQSSLTLLNVEPPLTPRRGALKIRGPRPPPPTTPRSASLPEDIKRHHSGKGKGRAIDG